MDNNTAPNVQQPQAEANNPDSMRFALLAKKEKAIREQARAIEDERAQLQAKLSKYETDYVSRESLKQNPLQVLNSLGLSYDKLTEQATQFKPDDMKFSALEQQISRITAMLESQQKQAQERESSQYKQALSQIKFDASQLVSSNPEFEMLKAYGEEGLNEVMSLIEETYKTQQRIMPVEEAAKAIEDHYTQEILKAAKMSKISKLLNPQAAEPETSTQSPVENKGNPVKPRGITISPRQGGIETLNSAATSSSQMSARDRAIAILTKK